MISLQGKTNFFERRVGEYQKAGVMSGFHRQLTGEGRGGEYIFTTQEDF
jgi:hypothetical protein